MARIARVVVPDFPHHVVQRGVRRMDVFFSSEDLEEYINLLSQSASKHGLEFVAWCLMSNHAHFVVVPRQQRSLAGAFGEAHRRYTRLVNFREGWRGHLWQERFHSYPMNERHLVAAVRYVELNPVRAGLAEKAEDWEWSSARYHLGLRPTDRLVRKQDLFGLLNGWDSYLRQRDEDRRTNFDLHLRTGRPLGNPEFVEKLEQFVGRRLRPRRGGWLKGKLRS